ncbi:hypothetical protein CY35_14G042900 [Sphagnum magellanicum]|nr:hypothetical protein CY35_14G042900 [Sphagnum magellanicum]
MGYGISGTSPAAIGAVKADNVLMQSDLTPKHMDYGVAHYMQRRRISPTLTNVDWVLRQLLPVRTGGE